MDKLVNGCTKQETLELMELLQDVPFCHTWQMSKCDECGMNLCMLGLIIIKNRTQLSLTQ